jgi:Mg-chelatase subunit ChlD
MLGLERVHLIGVRHHSPVLAAAMPALLDAAHPDALLVELPAEMRPWLEWLAHPDTRTPVALAAAGGGDRAGGDLLAFYPFADFSPELAALRWAARHEIPVHCCDLPLADPAWRAPEGRISGDTNDLTHLIAGQLSGREDEDLWDRWVEAQAPGSPPEAIRRAALAAGWALRNDAPSVGELDLRRESWMRQRIRETPGTLAVVVGAFHAPALAPPGDAQPSPHSDPPPGDAQPDDPPPPSQPSPQNGAPPSPHGDRPETGGRGAAVISLVPFTFELLDARSGYPAGIRDPRWQQAVFECGGDPARLTERTRAFAVEVARAVRAQGQPAGPAEAAEAARLAVDLATLRGLPAPGRGELVEALQTVLAQGEPVGRGRIVAEAMRGTLIGEQRGRLAAGAPRSGLVPAVGAALEELRLPGPGRKPETVRLDALRSPLDRSREVFLRRLSACHVQYGEVRDGDGELLTTQWRLHWTPATDAGLAVAALHGVTLEQAAMGTLAQRHRREVAEGGPTAVQTLAGLAHAAACALPPLTTLRLAEVHSTVCQGGSLTEIVSAIELVLRLERGHFPGSPPTEAVDVRENLYAAAVSSLEGLAGSNEVGDARALTGLVHHLAETGRLLRLEHLVAGIARNGSPLMRGAASAVSVLLGLLSPSQFGEYLASWLELASAECTERLRGALTAAGSLLRAAEQTLAPLLDRIEALPDDTFVARLPSLRAGFDALSPADRQRLLDVITDRSGQFDTELATDAAVLAAWLAADRAGLAAVTALDLAALDPAALDPATPDPATPPGGILEENGRPGSKNPPRSPHDLSPAQRWRLLLGREAQTLPPGTRRLATALDELYGTGQGEGSHTVDRGRGPGGRERSTPQAREWLEELEALFGKDIREEVLARAAEAGRAEALLAVEPEAVRPSMDLLHAVLTLAGGLPEARLARLRPLVDRLVREMTAQLARRIRPALTGIGIPRRTRRPTGRLDLAATVRANLHTVRVVGEHLSGAGPKERGAGKIQLVPERLVFRSRGRRSVDWQIVLVVDVSGSMEESTIWAALTAAVLAGVPALRTHFVTFSTEVMDLTDRVDDPLGLLLEISVGGGTHIAAGLRYARQIVTTPSRTIVVVISDFEEGYPLGGLLEAVRALIDDGVTLLGCASLDDRGQPRYSTGVAGRLVAAGMPVAALSPAALAHWIGERVK